MTIRNQSVLSAAIGLAVLALVSAASASENTARPGCPNGYARLGDICFSAETGDIVLPAVSTAEASEQARAGR